MNVKPAFGFVVQYVKDIEASKRFYSEVLGLEIEREHPTFVQFETFAIAADEPMGEKGTHEVYWLVDDAQQAFDTLSKKTEVCLPLKQVPFGIVFGIKDPDGVPRYILELSKDRPSQTVKSTS